MAPCQVDSLKLHRKAPPSKDKQYFPGFFCFSGKIKKKHPTFMYSTQANVKSLESWLPSCEIPVGAFAASPGTNEPGASRAQKPL